MSSGFKNFVTEEEVTEQRQRRQAEWDKVRKEDDPAECPEEESRSLFDQLQANKSTQDKEYEDESRLRSSVKGLDDEEAQFLNFVSNRQVQLERERSNEEKRLIKEMEAAKVIKISEKAKSQEQTEQCKPKSSTLSTVSSSNRRSQHQLLSGAIKRKSLDKCEEKQDSKKSKPDDDSSDDPTTKTAHSDAKLLEGLAHNRGLPVVAGILPGIAGYEYDDDSSTENSSRSSDSEEDHKVYPGAVTQRVLQDMVKKIKEQAGCG